MVVSQKESKSFENLDPYLSTATEATVIETSLRIIGLKALSRSKTYHLLATTFEDQMAGDMRGQAMGSFPVGQT